MAKFNTFGNLGPMMKDTYANKIEIPKLNNPEIYKRLSKLLKPKVK